VACASGRDGNGRLHTVLTLTLTLLSALGVLRANVQAVKSIGNAMRKSCGQDLTTRNVNGNEVHTRVVSKF
jgi:hypothetical protein